MLSSIAFLNDFLSQYTCRDNGKVVSETCNMPYAWVQLPPPSLLFQYGRLLYCFERVLPKTAKHR